jgi:glucose-6-phosphate dehydrogenase assembly protein OpcA
VPMPPAECDSDRPSPCCGVHYPLKNCYHNEFMMEQTVLLESPKAVSLALIEQELTQLWKEAESGSGEAIRPVIRACTMNLIVVTEDEKGADAVTAMVGEVTLEHPARIFLAVLDRQAKESSLNAWISARCAMPEPGQEQVCCEQITLVARGRDTEKITSLITSLLVPDVSTMLLWKTSIDDSDPILRSLLAVTDRALIDSSEELAPLHALLAWKTLVHAGIGVATLGDLGWTHVTAWRAVVGRAFQPPEARQLLDALDSVTIEYSSTLTPRHSGFSQALLLMGWLAHALEWRSAGALCSVQEGSVHAVFRKGMKSVQVFLRPVVTAGKAPGGIERITISAGADFNVELREGEPRSEIVLTAWWGKQREQSVVPLRTLSESELMAGELEILQRDEQYEQSLDTLAAVVSGDRNS